jgi:hypothetical protein
VNEEALAQWELSRQKQTKCQTEDISGFRGNVNEICLKDGNWTDTLLRNVGKELPLLAA